MANHPHIHFYTFFVIFIMSPTCNLWLNFHQELVNVFFFYILLAKRHIEFMILPFDNSSLVVMLFSMKIHFPFQLPLHPIIYLQPLYQLYLLTSMIFQFHPLPLTHHQRHLSLLYLPLLIISHHHYQTQHTLSLSSLSSSSSKPNISTPILLRSERPRQPSILLCEFHCGQVDTSSSSTTMQVILFLFRYQISIIQLYLLSFIISFLSVIC